ncbi:MAG: hypothetical protein AAGB01_03650 [Cyanobacteria bacterium P01_F01_bin.42]
MYRALHEQFRGAWQGCAIGEADANPSLGQALIAQGQHVMHLGQYDSMAAIALAGNDLSRLAYVILVSMLCHDAPEEQQQALSALSNQSLGLLLLSEAIAAQLRSQRPTFETNSAFRATLDQLIQGQLPLQTVVATLMAWPGLSPFEQAIGLGVYCWYCHPHQFTICIGRSRQIQRYVPQSHPAKTLSPALVGLLCGAAVGSRALPIHESLDLTHIYAEADRLYCLWAGINPAAASSGLEQSVIAQAGQLKPRSYGHLTLNREYD